MTIALADTAHVAEHMPLLCATCGERPRLGSLTRCKRCLQAHVDVDRRQREARAAPARSPAADRSKRADGCEIKGEAPLKKRKPRAPVVVETKHRRHVAPPRPQSAPPSPPRLAPDRQIRALRADDVEAG